MESSRLVKLDGSRIRGPNLQKPCSLGTREGVAQEPAGNTLTAFGGIDGQIQDFALAGCDLSLNQIACDTTVHRANAAIVLEVIERIPLGGFRGSGLDCGDHGHIREARAANRHLAFSVHRRIATPNSGITASTPHTGVKPMRSTTLPIQGERKAVISPKDEVRAATPKPA